MRLKKLCLCLTAAALVCVAAPRAHAWGDRAQRSITLMGMQLLKQEYPQTFRASDSNYERDVIAGAEDGHDVLMGIMPIESEGESIQAIGTEIQLLRNVRSYGPGSYFAYRMGVLSALVSDVVLPYGFGFTAREQRIQAAINADIDAVLDGYAYKQNQRYRNFLNTPTEYFQMRRKFYNEDKRIIGEDYDLGRGYKGFLSESGEVYFSRAVESVADVWYTVMRPEAGPGIEPASRRSLTWYFVHEIAYLLEEKHNLAAASKAYDNFEQVNPGIADAYERIGDLYYAYGTEASVKRAVDEWQKAHNMAGADRQRVASKLSSHFLEVGRDYLALSSEPGSDPNLLTNALHAFEEALNFDRTSNEAATLIQETNVAKRRKEERFQTTLDIIAKGSEVREQAERQRLAEDLGNAIQTYRKAIVIFEAVDDEFADQEKTAKENIQGLKKDISEVINDILDLASDAIDDGEQLQDNHQYEQAIASFKKVPTIVAMIPEDVKQQHLDDKDQMLTLAGDKEDEAKRAKLRWEEAQREQQAAAQGR